VWVRGVGRGGKALLGQQRGEGFKESLLIFLNGQQVIGALLIKNLFSGLHLGVGGIGQHDLIDHVEFGQLRARGRDFMAAFLDHGGAQPATRATDGADRLHVGMTDFLAVEDYQPVLHRSQDLFLP